MLRGRPKNLTPSPSPCKGEGNKKKLWLPFSLQGEGVGGYGAFSFHVTSVSIAKNINSQT